MTRTSGAVRMLIELYELFKRLSLQLFIGNFLKSFFGTVNGDRPLRCPGLQQVVGVIDDVNNANPST